MSATTDDDQKSNDVSIAREIRELIDLRAIEALKYRYVQGADAVNGTHDLDVLMSCFVSDARWCALILATTVEKRLFASFLLVQARIGLSITSLILVLPWPAMV